jgi:predicted RNA-binding protein with PUA-like domain
MNYWLLLADPTTYGYEDLSSVENAVWDGISGAPAQKNLRQFKKGDTALIYHTAPEKAVVGTARVISDPYPDPKDETGKRVVVDVRAESRLARRVPLANLRDNPKLSDMAFVKIQRIAVSPVSKREFDEILRMSR